jgi:transposase
MPKRIVLELNAEERQALRQIRDTDAKAYLRERAAALLKVADGATVTEVAERGLHKRHELETVHGWIKRYQQQGVEGLKVRPGSGRKPAFSPSARDTGAGDSD